MPKRKKKTHSAKAEQRAAAKSKPTSRKHRNHERAREIPHDGGDPPPGTLGHYFYSLNQELRDEIFAWLLVRPVRWDREHKPSCPATSRSLTHPKFQMNLSNVSPGVCAEMYGSATEWRHRDDEEDPISENIWRSRWAPPKGNPYLCGWCEPEFRQKPHPVSYDMPCDCARRDNLETLLVCRRWYEEAGRVFYTRNTLAFADVPGSIDFFENLPARWKPALSELELDAIMLTRLPCVKVFNGPKLQNLRRITFTQTDPNYIIEASRRFVWPGRALRREINDSEFAEQVARRIKGQRYGWKRGEKRGDVDAKAVEEEKRRYRKRNKDVYVPLKDEESDEDEN